ncbi:MAG: cytochrome c biosis protein CcmG, thiol:disulfide interchange protein DsbE, partial [Thermoleophilaceae bacterium]|nr:cytochrome c biosis protein CcmG, thiol:disulfide interchange protein DsbE [Thermoleophilaceae bacterium]
MEVELGQPGGGNVEPQRPPGRRRRSLRLLAPALGLAVAAGFIALLAYGLIARSPNTGIDDSLAQSRPFPAPPFRLAVLRHGSLGAALEPKVAAALADGFVSPAELRGTPYVLNIWASWCVPCRDEAPLLMRIAQDKRIRVVGMNQKDRPENARRFLGRYGNPYVASGADANGRASIEWGVYGVPETFVVGRDGRIAFKLIGPITRENI